MSDDIDSRERVIDFIENGGRKTDAAVLFQVSQTTIYNWLNRPNLEVTPIGNCDDKLKKEEHAPYVKDYPDSLQRERAMHFGVRKSTICEALKTMGRGNTVLSLFRQMQTAVSQPVFGLPGVPGRGDAFQRGVDGALRPAVPGDALLRLTKNE